MPKPKRILYCEGNLDQTIGGSYYSLFYLVSGLDPGYQPLVVFYNENFVAQLMREKGIAVQILEAPGREGGFLGKIPLVKRLTQFALPTLALARLLRRERIDLVHLNNSVAHNHAWMAAARFAGIPCITHERALNPSFGKSTHLLANKLDRIICISKAVRDNLLRQNIGSENSEVIFNGINPAKVRPVRAADQVRAEFGIAPGQIVIGIVGNIAEWKGQETVVRAVGLLKQRFHQLVCLLVGDISPNDKEFADRLKEQVRHLRVESNIIFTGYQKNVADFMNIMDVVLHASIEPEPFGRVIVEAMALSKPVIGSRDGGVTEIIVDGESGLLFTPGSAEELAARVTEILDNPEKARSMGAAALRRVNAEFHIDRNVERTMNVYKKLLPA